MVLKDSEHGRRGEDKSLAAIWLFRSSLFRADADERQTVVVFREPNPRCLAKLRVLDRRKFDDKPFAREGGQLVDRANRFVEMMDHVEQTNVIELFVQRLKKNVALEELHFTADDLF